jgi:hypothetical protein
MAASHVCQSTLRHTCGCDGIFCHSGLRRLHLGLLFSHHSLAALKLRENEELGCRSSGCLHLTDQLFLREVLQALLKFEEVHPTSPR